MIKRSEKGSITLFTLIAMMFFLTIAFTAYTSAMIKLQAQNEDLERIKASYEQDLTEEGLASLYEKLTTVVGKYAGEVLKTDMNATELEKKSPYVMYDGNLYRVLYDRTSHYGIELISNSTVGENVLLGQKDPAGNDYADSGNLGTFKRAVWSYTNVIETLNKVVTARVDVSDGIVNNVRCVGSIPDNKNYKSSDKQYHTDTNPYFENWDGLFEQAEEVKDSYKNIWIVNNPNHKLDFIQLEKLDLKNIGKEYWLASRYGVVFTSNTNFYNWYINNTGDLTRCPFFGVDYKYNSNFYPSYSYGVRPVLHLSPSTKIIGGKGTESEPYTLGL